MLMEDDATLEDLTETGAWLATAPIKKVQQFVSGGGVRAISGVLGNLCRFESRGDADSMKIEAAMRCLKALVKAEFGLKAVIDSPSSVCSAFASGGGSLLIADAEALLQPAVLVLSAVAVFSPEGHQVSRRTPRRTPESRCSARRSSPPPS